MHRVTFALLAAAIAACGAPSIETPTPPEPKPIPQTMPEPMDPRDQSEAPIQPSDVHRLFETNTTADAISNLLYDGSLAAPNWPNVTAGIASGDKEWLALAPQIQRGLEAREKPRALADLARALNNALIENPEGVLGLLDTKMFAIKPTCQNGLVDVKSGAELKARHAAQVSALESLDYRYTYPHYIDVRDACLRSLNDAYTLEIKSR